MLCCALHSHTGIHTRANDDAAMLFDGAHTVVVVVVARRVVVTLLQLSIFDAMKKQKKAKMHR